jgi:capping protein beta
MNPNTPYEPSGSWDSIHVFEAVERGRQAHYKLTSTIMLQLITKMGTDNDSKSNSEKRATEGWKRDGEVSLSGSMTRQVRFYLRMVGMIVEQFLVKAEQDWPLHDSSSHITNIGRMIEEMEIKMRNLLQEVRDSLPCSTIRSFPFHRCTLGKHETLCTIFVALMI